MDITDATKILLKNGIKVLKQAKNLYSVSYLNGQPWENSRYSSRSYKTTLLGNNWTGREIIKLARAYTDSNQQTTLNKNVKKFNNDKDRRATRDAINTENFDVIPPKKETLRENRWSWD